MGLGGFQPSFCRYIHRNFCKIKGKADQDRIKNAGRKSGILQETFGRLCFRFFRNSGGVVAVVGRCIKSSDKFFTPLFLRSGCSNAFKTEAVGAV